MLRAAPTIAALARDIGDDQPHDCAPMASAKDAPGMKISGCPDLPHHACADVPAHPSSKDKAWMR
jgi:hypothetical protein